MRKIKEKISIDFEVEYDAVIWKGNLIPKTVYKYRNWDDINHRKILEEISIWVPDSNNFNDPFDCNIPIAYNLLSTDDAVAEKFIRNMVENNKSKFPDGIEKEISRRLAENKHKDPVFITGYTADTLEANKKVNGVFSVTPVNNNILMWSHYANSHKGFCVGFDSVKLFECLMGGGAPVNYATEYPIISPIEIHEEQYRQQILTKSKHWAYEFEYRLTTFRRNNMSIPIPPDAITEIIFGAKMNNEFKTQIKRACNKLSHIKFFNSIPNENEFKLNIVPEKT